MPTLPPAHQQALAQANATPTATIRSEAMNLEYFPILGTPPGYIGVVREWRGRGDNSGCVYAVSVQGLELVEPAT